MRIYFLEICYQTRTRREVDRVTKKKVYYKEWQETYVAQVIIAIHYHNSVINARVSAAQYDSLVSETINSKLVATA
jgi:hypothetical protein